MPERVLLFPHNHMGKEQYALNNTILKQVRQQIYDCFERGADALFNLCDALLSETQARSLVELSQSPFFERQWPSLYQALDEGTINETKLRATWVQALLAPFGKNETVWISVDASSIARPEAETSEDRGIIHVCNLPRAVKPISGGWQFSTVMLLPEQPSSWVGVLDQRRISTKQTAIEVGIAQIQTVAALVQQPLVIVADRWYATAEFLQACHHLGCQVLIRLKRNRKLYRPAVRTKTKGRPPLDGPLLQGSRPETLFGSQAMWFSRDGRGHLVKVSRWNDVHLRQARDIALCAFRVQREGAKGTRRDPRESWFLSFDAPAMPIALPDVRRVYGRRFSHEHGYRYLKQDLLWTRAHVRAPEQFERWSLIVGTAMNQLCLAQSLGHACYRPWEGHHRNVTPAQVRRVMPSILMQVGTPTRRCQRRGKSPGRACGFHPKPAPRYDVVVKGPKKPSKASG
jgi:hypothetical protein